MNKNAANYSIFSKKTGEFVGYCGIKNLTKEVPELAIELLKKCRKQGYGYQALSLLMDRFTGDTSPSGLPCSGSYIGDFNPAGVCRTLHGFYI